jgi:hypothetical protein
VAKSLNALASKGYIEVNGARTTITPQGAAFYNTPSVVPRCRRSQTGKRRAVKGDTIARRWTHYGAAKSRPRDR